MQPKHLKFVTASHLAVPALITDSNQPTYLGESSQGNPTAN